MTDNNDAVPVAWSMTDYQSDGAMTILTSDREQAKFWGEQGVQIDPLYPASVVDGLREEVERLRAGVTEITERGMKALAHVSELKGALANVFDHEDTLEAIAYWLCLRDGCDQPHQLIWSGSPPEPEGEVWHTYLPHAREMVSSIKERRSLTGATP